MHSLRRPDRLKVAFIWLLGYLFIDFVAGYYVRFIVNSIVENYYFRELFFYFGLLIYRPEVTQYCTAIKDAIVIFGTFIFIIWELYDNPAFRNDKQFMSRSLWQVLEDTYSHIICTCVGLTLLGVSYNLVNIVTISAM